MAGLPQFHDSPGYFQVLSQPASPEFVGEYHDWYNSEHGPLRLRLDSFLNGYRYRSRGDDPPVYLACYDLKRISGLVEPEYTVLREKRSEREAQLIARKLKFLDRRIYANISSRGRNGGPAPVIMTVSFVVKNEYVEELNRWYEEEHTNDLSRVPGWRRTRRFQLVQGDQQRQGYTELLAVHDFDRNNGLDGPEHELAKSKPWRQRIVELVESRENKRFEFFHEFDARDYRKPPLVNSEIINSEKASFTTSGATSCLLEGPDDGPVIVFSNSLLTDLHIWDVAVEKLKPLFPSFRFLRYNTRGYERPSEEKVTVDLLTDDLALSLDHFRIEKCHVVIGVSLGGITALNFALRYPQRLERFIACDCNAQSTAANTRAWQERILLAQSVGGWEHLAEQTVNRWFTAQSVAARTTGVLQVRQMILAASITGFENCVGALCDFDLSPKLTDISVPGCCVVGEQDGILPQTMSSFSKNMKAAWFAEIAGAGHLPMVENAVAFVDAIKPLLERRLTNRSEP